jgi:hypothetical protein
MGKKRKSEDRAGDKAKSSSKKHKVRPQFPPIKKYSETQQQTIPASRRSNLPAAVYKPFDS